MKHMCILHWTTPKSVTRLLFVAKFIGEMRSFLGGSVFSWFNTENSFSDDGVDKTTATSMFEVVLLDSGNSPPGSDL
jgi:hypothetical protein